jgi:hypothetical protein
MSLEKIVEAAMSEKPLDLKEAFEAEVEERVMAALAEKYKKAMEAKDEDDDEDDDDADEDEDDEDDDEDEDEK